MSKTCVTCKYAPPMKKWPCEDCDVRKPADRWEPKPHTRADRIRAMSDEELAEHLEEISNWSCPPGMEFTEVRCGRRPDCKGCWLDWLRQEADT